MVLGEVAHGVEFWLDEPELASAVLYKSAFTAQPILRGSITPGDAFYRSMHGDYEQA
jgi:hypothetical protein